jgi:protein-L-isoaspartate(D-aspartate) O-methyltransferase
LTFANTEPGRGSQALQGVSVDGRQIQSIEVSAWVRCQNIRAGQSLDQLPRILVNYFDEDRAPVGQEVLGPWDGSFPWTKKSTRVNVPPKARLAIIAIGLLGATGELSLDDIEVRAGSDLAQRPGMPTSAVGGPSQPGVRR